MDKLSAINFVVAAVVCSTIVGINIVAAIAQPSEERKYRILDSKKYPGTTWTLRLWGMWWLAIFFTYLGIDKYHYSYSLIFSGLGDICTLAAAVTYCTGRCLKPKMIFFLGGIFALELIWNIAMPAFFETPQGRILVVGPSTVISIISIVAFGWAVVVRCGWVALPFLFLTAMYSLAQLPAYFDKIVLGRDAEILRSVYFNQLRLSFGFLAIGKVFYALAFFGYFFSPTQNLEVLKHPRYFPSEDSKAQMHPKYARLFRWTVIVVVTSFLTTLIAATVPGFIDSVKQFFHL